MSKIQVKKNIVGLKELRENIGKYISRVDKGESFTIIRRSKPVFKITPLDVWETVADFTEINKEGVPAKDVLKVLKKLNA